MSEVWTIFLRYVVPSLVGAAAALIGVWRTVGFQSSSKAREEAASILKTAQDSAVQMAAIARDDAATLRNALMEERKQLVDEIRSLQKRCDELERVNLDRAGEIQKNEGLLQDLTTLQARFADLEKITRQQAAELLTHNCPMEEVQRLKARCDELEQKNAEQAAEIEKLQAQIKELLSNEKS